MIDVYFKTEKINDYVQVNDAKEVQDILTGSNKILNIYKDENNNKLEGYFEKDNKYIYISKDYRPIEEYCYIETSYLTDKEDMSIYLKIRSSLIDYLSYDLDDNTYDFNLSIPLN